MRRQYELWRAALQVQRVFQKVDCAVSHGMYGGADVAMGAQKMIGSIGLRLRSSAR